MAKTENQNCFLTKQVWKKCNLCFNWKKQSVIRKEWRRQDNSKALKRVHIIIKRILKQSKRNNELPVSSELYLKTLGHRYTREYFFPFGAKGQTLGFMIFMLDKWSIPQFYPLSQ